MRLMVVDDADDVAEAIIDRLASLGHVCDRVATLSDARHLLGIEPYDLVILDINLPDGNGLDFLRSLRAARNPLPVLMLTAKLGVDDRVEALDAGADDYVVKPFDFRELEARVRAILRRRHGSQDALLEAGAIRFNTATREVTVGGVACELTRREQSLLEILLTSRGKVIPKEELHGRLFTLDDDVGMNAVELYVARLRKKIPPPSLTIRSLRGLGYQVITESAHGDR